ncbi:MAG: hypothetical protein JOZ07_01685 [Solirubrobacterales bacterium]|nr:hypothetical protein [Solirubrobacterales bacterium]
MSEPLICAGCGLLCDDVTAEGTALTPECALGSRWLAARRDAGGAAASIDGAPADVTAALDRAVELLGAARRPLLHGFDGATVEDARAAVTLADRLGALVRVDRAPDPEAVARRGSSTATLGEIRDRAEVVVVWREDPEVTHPRLLERLGSGATLVVVDDRDTATAARADVRLRWAAGRDLEAIRSLHVLERELPLTEDDLAGELRGLLDRLHAVPHAAFVHGPGLGGPRAALALYELVRALSDQRHVVTLGLPPVAGSAGADAVLTWQTGYPAAVDLASGHPELALAVDEGVDVAVCVEAPARPGVTTIALSALPVADAAVHIATAPPGVAAPGTAHRLDEVPLALAAPWPADRPTAAQLLARIGEGLAR